MSTEKPTSNDTTTRRGASPVGNMDTMPAPSSAPGRELIHHEIPLRIGRYEILERIGSGGMGVVFLGRDPELERKVAIKLLHPERSEGEQRARLLREAQAMARLSHPNVIHVYEVGTVGEQVFVAMEYVQGVTLARWQRNPRISWREILSKFVAAGRGLQAAHHAGLVHRDFKPDNVLVGRRGEVRVVDFGLARAGGDPAHLTRPPVMPSAEGSDSRDSFDQDLTRTGALMGTPAYMAPEQLRGDVPDARADQFAFCVSLYEGLYGERPFEGKSFADLSANVLGGKVSPAPPYTDVPPRTRMVLLRGLSRRPRDRYRSLEELLTALGRDPTAVWRWTLGSVAMLAFAGIVAFAWSSFEAERQARVEAASVQNRFQRGALFHSVERIADLERPSPRQRWDALVLAQASARLSEDPSAAVATLKLLSRDSEDWLAQARVIASDAVRQGVVRWRLRAGADLTPSLAMSADGETLCAGARNGDVLVWRPKAGSSDVLEGHKGPVNGVAVSSRGEVIVSGGDDGTARVWTLDTHKGRVFDRRDEPVLAVAVSADASFGVSAAADGIVRRLDLETDEQRAMKNHDGPVRAVDISADGATVASASDDQTMRVWHVATGTVRKYEQHGRPLVDAALIGADRVVSLDVDGVAGLWNPETTRSGTLPWLEGVEQVATNADGTFVATVGIDGHASIHERIGTAWDSMRVGLRPRSRLSAAMSGNGRVVALSNSDRTVEVLDRPSVELLRPAAGGPIRALDFVGDAVLVTASSSGMLRRWDLSSGKESEIGRIEGAPTGLAVSPTGDVIAVTSASEWSLWTLDGARLHQNSRVGDTPPIWSHDGRAFAFLQCWEDLCGSVRVDAETGAREPSESLHESLDFIRVGLRASTVIIDSTTSQEPARVWNVGDGELIPFRPAVEPDPGRRLAIVVDPDVGGVRLATAKPFREEGMVRVRIWLWRPHTDSVYLLHEELATGEPKYVRGRSAFLLDTERAGPLLWDLAAGHARPIPRELLQATTVVLSPDREHALIDLPSDEGAFQRFALFDLRSGSRRALPNLYQPVAFSADGSVLADAPPRGDIRVFRGAGPTEPKAFLDWLDTLTDARVDAASLGE